MGRPGKKPGEAPSRMGSEFSVDPAVTRQWEGSLKNLAVQAALEKARQAKVRASGHVSAPHKKRRTHHR